MESQILLSGVSITDFFQRVETLIDSKLQNVNPQNETPSGYYTRKETAALLKITLPTLNDYTKQGFLKPYKIGNRVLYRPGEVEQCLENLSSTPRNKKPFGHAQKKK